MLAVRSASGVEIRDVACEGGTRISLTGSDAVFVVSIESVGTLLHRRIFKAASTGTAFFACWLWRRSNSVTPSLYSAELTID